MASKHHTLVAINSESRQTSFQSFCALPSDVAVLFNSNLSRRPLLGQVTFHLRPILLQTLVAIDSESCQTSFPSFCAQPSEVSLLRLLKSLLKSLLLKSLLLKSLCCLSRRPSLGQAVWADALSSDRSERPMNDCKIDRSDGCSFGLQQLLAHHGILWEFYFQSVVTTRYLQSIKTFLTVKLSQDSKRGNTPEVSCFPQASLSLPSATTADSKMPWPAQAVPERSPKSSSWPMGCKKTWPMGQAWPMGCIRFYLLRNPKIKFNKLCGVWILFRTPKLRTPARVYQPSSIGLIHETLTWSLPTWL